MSQTSKPPQRQISTSNPHFTLIKLKSNLIKRGKIKKEITIEEMDAILKSNARILSHTNQRICRYSVEQGHDGLLVVLAVSPFPVLLSLNRQSILRAPW